MGEQSSRRPQGILVGQPERQRLKRLHGPFGSGLDAIRLAIALENEERRAGLSAIIHFLPPASGRVQRVSPLGRPASRGPVELTFPRGRNIHSAHWRAISTHAPLHHCPPSLSCAHPVPRIDVYRSRAAHGNRIRREAQTEGESKHV